MIILRVTDVTSEAPRARWKVACSHYLRTSTYFFGAFAKLRKTASSFVMSVWPLIRGHGTARLPLDRLSRNLIWECFENLSRKSKFHSNLTKITGAIHEDLCTLMIVSCWIILRMRIFSDKSCRKNQNTFYVQQLFPENRAVYIIVWKNVVEPGRPQMTI
jgi:hypothetical protein